MAAVWKSLFYVWQGLTHLVWAQSPQIIPNLVKKKKPLENKWTYQELLTSVSSSFYMYID